MKRLIIILTLALAAIGWQACIPRYTFNGASIDYNVYKTISFGEFPIRAALGEMTNDQLSPQAVGEDAYASQTRLTITVKVKYINNKNQSLSKDLSFSAYRDFPSSELLIDVQDELCNQICKDLSDLIFNATLGDW